MVNVTDHSSPQQAVTMLPASGTTSQSSKTLSSAASGLLSGTNTTLPLAEPKDNLYKANINSRTMRDHFRTLVDRGANGGVVGDDMRIVSTTDRSINIQGLQKHTINDLILVTAGGVTRTQMGEVIIILHQMASMPGQKTIISALQLEHFKCSITDKAPKANRGRPPRVTIPEGHSTPLAVRNGLLHMEL